MPRDHRAYLEDILASADRIARYADNLTYEQFLHDELKQDGIVRNLEIIGEAAKRLPDEMKAAHPEIEWRKVAGLRDIVIHNYSGLDLALIWEAATAKLEPLRRTVRELLDGKQ
jgi:uncharacterized protein with HEPN domain